MQAVNRLNNFGLSQLEFKPCTSWTQITLFDDPFRLVYMKAIFANYSYV
jgi:hypothetical protein